jgi:hypothetical protein
MTTSVEAPTTVLQHIDSIGSELPYKLSDLVVETLIQSSVAEASELLDSKVLAQGKVFNRPTPKKKVVPVVSADALVGDDHFLRPNGEKYFSRKWGEHDDVMVLRNHVTKITGWHWTTGWPAQNCADTDGYVDVRTGKKYALHGDDSFFKDIGRDL